MFDIDQIKLIVGQLSDDSSVSSVSLGDELIEVNGRSLADHMRLLVPEFRMSTLAHGLVRLAADAVSEYYEARSSYLYRGDGNVLYRLRQPDGTDYEVLVPTARTRSKASIGQARTRSAGPTTPTTVARCPTSISSSGSPPMTPRP